MAKFNLNALLNEASKGASAQNQREASGAGKPRFVTEAISVHDLIPSEKNFYSMEQIEKLARHIELAGGIKENLTATPLDNGKYKLLAGHRRRLATLLLLQEGKAEYEYVPCVIEEREQDAELQEIKEEILLIVTNSQREKTDFDRVQELERLRAALERYEEREKLPGRTRDIIASTLNTSAGQIGRLDAISRHLVPEFREALENQDIGLSVAYEISGLPEAEQRQMYAEKIADGRKETINLREVRQAKEAIARVKREDENKTPPMPQKPKAEKVDVLFNGGECCFGGKCTNEKGIAVLMRGGELKECAACCKNCLKKAYCAARCEHYRREGAAPDVQAVLRALRAIRDDRERAERIEKYDIDAVLRDAIAIIEAADNE